MISSALHATSGTYTDKAFMGYDKAIRDKAKTKGVKAFKMGDQQLAMLHFTLANTRTMRELRKFGRPSFVNKTFDYGKKICYAYNYAKDGCSARLCDYEHKCISCKSGDHTVDKCNRKRY